MIAQLPDVIVTAESGSIVLRLLGRSHPAIVHFPIALLMLAAALEVWQLIRRKPGLAAATPLCIIVGALTALVAAVFGWLLEGFDGNSGELLAVHKWVGNAAVVGGAAAALLIRP